MSAASLSAFLLLTILSLVDCKESSILHPLDFLSLQSICKVLIRPSRFGLPSTVGFHRRSLHFSRRLLRQQSHCRAIPPRPPRRISRPFRSSQSRNWPPLRALRTLPCSRPRHQPHPRGSLLLLFPALSRPQREFPLRPDSLINLLSLSASHNRFKLHLLSGEIPPHIFSLLALSNIVLSYNHLTGKIHFLPSSSELLRLDVKHNNLSGELPVFPRSLRYLAASRNKISGRIDVQFSELINLDYVDLSMNRLTGPIPSGVFSLPLSLLLLQQNELAGTVAPAADVKIKEVDLRSNGEGGESSERNGKSSERNGKSGEGG